jgi:imidazoleglycerol-phosphate dehydratase/histidinol-phosphatase
MRRKKQKIVIDKRLLDPNSKLSYGLISGMKELVRLGYEIQVNGINKKEFSELRKIIEMEGINLVPKPSKSLAYTITVSRDEKKSIQINLSGKYKNLSDAVNEIKKRMRSAYVVRITKETEVRIKVSLDGIGKSKISTGIRFFDHMLEQIARHSNINLEADIKGDLSIDEHHTVEDTGISLGSALYKALGDKRGIKRYGFFLPMDDSAAICAIDLGGRAYLNFNCKFNREKVGEFPTELTEEFFRALSAGLKANIYIKATGKNDHHKTEAIFKAFAKALNEACRLDERSAGILPSTKGVL